jgi:O-antigen/teichoic acid export membrane protein
VETGRVARLRREVSVPMYRNAYALMLNTIVNSGLGLLYWIVAARTSTPDDVGRGNALISLMLLVSILTQADFGQALIRFLPRAGAGTRRLVLMSYGVAVGLALLGATVAMAWCHLLLDAADPLHVSLPFACWFVVSTVAWSVFSLQDSALTGLRASVWIPLENAVYGVVKLGLLVVVARTSLSDGVFTSWTLPVLALLVPVNLLLFRRLVPRHAASTGTWPGRCRRRSCRSWSCSCSARPRAASSCRRRRRSRR